ncbi:hypothetical protein ID866_609 [Astraeus odoratus]|nr:hypothetical protein ID866_609 [Astraeus odoratus]
MPASEIDEIFASKGKSKQPAPTDNSSLFVADKKKKKKRLPSTQGKNAVVSEPPKSSTKRSNPETIVDPSLDSNRPKRQKTKGHSSAGTLSKKNTSKEISKDDEERFRDSRGTGPHRKTEEGYNIYKEDELRIGNEGGGTLARTLRDSLLFNYLQIRHFARLIAIVVCHTFAASMPSH